MHNIVISGGDQVITMPITRELSVSGEEVCREITMANGKIIKEMIGHRTIVSASWDWVPVETMAELHMLLRRGGFFDVTYSDPGGTVRTGLFSIRYPQSQIFKFTDIGAVWHMVTLSMRSQGVE